jgi:hypothetical protein
MNGRLCNQAESESVMGNGCRLITGMIASVLIMGLTEAQAGTKGSMPCIKTRLTVENLSNHPVRISELRWLNSAGDSWFTKSADSGELAAGDKWQTEFCISGVDSGSTFVSINYDVLLDAKAGVWSGNHSGKQVHVQLTPEPVEARLDIARRNFRIP